MQENEQHDIKKDVEVSFTVTGKEYFALYLSNIVAVPGVNLTCDINVETEAQGVRDAFEKGEQIVVLSSNKGQDNPEVIDFCSVACLCTVKRIIPQGKFIKVMLVGDARVKVLSIKDDDKFLVRATLMLELNNESQTSYELVEEIKKRIIEFSRGNEPLFPAGLQMSILSAEVNPSQFADSLVHVLAQQDIQSQQELLKDDNVETRLTKVLELLNLHIERWKLRKKIDTKVNDKIAQTQKEMLLREQLHVINDELNGEVDEIEDMTNRVKALGLPEESEKKVLKEVNRLGKLPFGSPELGYIRNFLDTVLELPWTQKTEDNIDIKQAKQILNNEHYALDEVKDRILELLAVIKLTQKVNAQIICLVGRPGVGKTSIAQSIANAMGRKYVQVSLGGVNDESVIRGHRRTYVGAMCGRILAGMKQAGTINPVFLLDEVDKLTSDARGDPSSALLEVLDPAQNDHFKDNFLEIPYDLSQVLFVLTANDINRIPRPLLDRMEIIKLENYTNLEKIQIAQKYLIKKEEKLAGLKEGTVELSDDLINLIIEKYTAEGGVRSLERCIAKICRKYASNIVSKEKIKTINKENMSEFLGNKYYEPSDIFQGGNVGETIGLWLNEISNGTLLIEATLAPGVEKIILTGKQGDMMKESCHTAYSFIKSNYQKFGISPKKFKSNELHINLPQMYNGVEGNSAGIATATAILSAYTEIPIKPHLAMTGEISLLGRVLPIGGVRDKLIAAVRAGVQTVLIPKDNEREVADVPKEITSKLQIIPVTQFSQVIELALQKQPVPLKEKTS